MALVISFLITFWVAYLIYKKYKPQPVLVVGGFILMYTAVIFGYGQILAPKASTGSILFDTFQFQQGLDGHPDQRPGGANLIHVFGESAHAHNVQAQLSYPG